MRCSPPKQFQDEKIRLNGTAEEYHYKGKPLMYSCVEGYILVTTPGMKTIIFCNKQGRWSNEGDEDSPECRRKFPSIEICLSLRGRRNSSSSFLVKLINLTYRTLFCV